jgi:hypothetical protein
VTEQPHAFVSALRSTFRRERLPPPPEGSTPRRGPGLAALLFGLGPLPMDPVRAPARRGRWLRWLFVPEPLDPP